MPENTILTYLDKRLFKSNEKQRWKREALEWRNIYILKRNHWVATIKKFISNF